MSMQMLTVLQFTEILIAYGIVTLAFPWLFFRGWLRNLEPAEKLLGTFLFGNFFIIYLVFLLQFLRISCRATLILGTLAPFLIRFLKRSGKQLPEKTARWLQNIKQLLTGEMGKKTAFLLIRSSVYRKCSKGQRKKVWKLLPDLLLGAVIVGGVLYRFGPNLIQYFGYKASDVPVHNYWINSMDDNMVFVAGVYPFGFHCVLYYLHALFDIKVYVLLRVFCLVQTIFVVLAMLVSLKVICRSRFAPYLGAGVYVFADLFQRNTYARFASTLPQEYGMLFIFPAACLAIRFFQEYGRELQEEKVKGKSERQEQKKARSRKYLLLFLISFSLTLTVHFYNTMIAGLFCVGIAVGYCFRLVQGKYFRKILVTGILSVLLAVLPMGIGVALGRGLQGSLYWGMNVIRGSTDHEVENNFTENASRESAADKMEAEETENPEKTGQSPADRAELTENSQKESISVKIAEIIRGAQIKFRNVFSDMRGSITRNVTNNRTWVSDAILAGTVVLFVLGILFFLFQRADTGGMAVSVATFAGLLCILESAKALGLPALMDSSRCSIFLAYAACFLWAVDLDVFCFLLFGWFRKPYAVQIASALLISLGSGALLQNHLLTEPIVVEGWEDNGSIICLTNIMREEPDFTWTICSANDELRMTDAYGYHYEMIQFLREQEDPDTYPEIIIPTRNVYFFIEKEPLNYYDPNTKGRVSLAGANTKLPWGGGLEPYYGNNRWVTMSHMYYWAQAFRRMYPEEMEVYYESDTFVCYRVRQNVNSPYNFALDYGYNHPESS